MSWNSYQNNGDWVQNGARNELAQQVASKTIAGVYSWMSGGVLLSAGVGVGLVQSNLINVIFATGRFALIAVFLMQIGLVFTMTLAANKLSTNTLKGLFLLYSAMTGLSFAVVMSVYSLQSVISIFAVAAIGFAALAVFGATTKKNLGFMATFLTMGLFMIMGAWILNMFMQSALLNSFVGWAGILVFSGLTAYDSQRIREGAYEIASANVSSNNTAIGKFMIFGALTMYLNFINLFFSLLRVLGGKNE